MLDINGGGILSENHDVNGIDFVAGMSDPGELIRCGYRPELRRLAGEQDAAYATRIRPLVMALPAEEREIIIGASIKRADLTVANGRVSVMVAGEAAWHKLGVNVKDAQTWEAAIKLANLDREVEKVQLKLPCGADATGAFATRYEDDPENVLGIVGSRYKVFQNRECGNLLDEVVGEKLAMYETAGSIKGGRVVWMMVKIPGDYRVNGSADVIEPYILLTTTHDGTGALKILPVSNRVVCANSHRVAVGRAKKGSEYTIKHSKNMAGRVTEIREKLGIIAKGFDSFMGQATTMAQFKMDDVQVDGYFKSLFPVEVKEPGEGVGGEFVKEVLESTAKKNAEIVKQLHENFRNETNTVPGIEGSAWAAYNATSQWVDHQKHYRGRDDAARLENQVFGTLMGSGVAVKAEAFQAALSMASGKA